MAERMRGAGWDAQAIQRIAKDHYGGLTELFEAHDWQERGQHMLPAVQGRVADAYGSVAAFDRSHPDVLMSPFDAIASDPPNVWLTSFYSFQPRNWGFFGFTDERMRTHFLRASSPGALVVVYGASGARSNERGRILGIQQVTHRVGHARLFMSDEHWVQKQDDPKRRGKWNHAVAACRAWRIDTESRMTVEAFAPITYTPGHARIIGSGGRPLDLSEARRILDLDLEEVQLPGGPAIAAPLTGPASEILTPSRAGPVSQAPYLVPEAEGPKHLYILKLNGNPDAFLGRSASGQLIVKIGFSKDPSTRCADLNRCLPRGAFSWLVHKATSVEGREPFPSSNHARAGEDAMKDDLQNTGSSLGSEFFLANACAIEAAWRRALEVARKWEAD